MRFLILNPTCLSLLDRHRPWLESMGVEVVTDPESDSVDHSMRGRSLQHLACGCDALIGPGTGPLRLDEDIASPPSRLKVISLASSGYEWVDIAAANRRGILVTHAPIDSLGEVVADMTWGLLLAAARRIPEHHLRLQQGDATRGMGTLVWGRTLGIVGLGNIGRKVAQRARGFEMRLLAVEKQPDGDFCSRHGVSLVDLDTLLKASDFVSLHLRLDATTHRIIGARELALMKPSAYLINTARADLVDPNALSEAILTHRIAGVALDDPPYGLAPEILHLPNVVFTPHIGNRVVESAEAVCQQAYENALQVVCGHTPELRYVLNPELLTDVPMLSSSA